MGFLLFCHFFTFLYNSLNSDFAVRNRPTNCDERFGRVSNDFVIATVLDYRVVRCQSCFFNDARAVRAYRLDA